MPFLIIPAILLSIWINYDKYIDLWIPETLNQILKIIHLGFIIQY